MPRRFFRKFSLKRHELSEKWFMAPFRRVIHDHRLWGIRRKNVVPAFAWGTFLACMPFPGQPLFAVVGSLSMRINIPVAVLVTFTSNPFTMGPLYFLAYRVGAHLLGLEPEPFRMEFSFEWVTTTFVNVWQPLLLGCVLLGAVAALIAYIVLDVLWRESVGRYKQRKRRLRHERLNNAE